MSHFCPAFRIPVPEVVQRSSFVLRSCGHFQIIRSTKRHWRDKALSPYRGKGPRLIPIHFISSGHKTRISVRCSSLMQTDSGAGVLMVINWIWQTNDAIVIRFCTRDHRDANAWASGCHYCNLQSFFLGLGVKMHLRTSGGYSSSRGSVGLTRVGWVLPTKTHQSSPLTP